MYLDILRFLLPVPTLCSMRCRRSYYAMYIFFNFNLLLLFNLCSSVRIPPLLAGYSLQTIACQTSKLYFEMLSTMPQKIILLLVLPGKYYLMILNVHMILAYLSQIIVTVYIHVFVTPYLGCR